MHAALGARARLDHETDLGLELADAGLRRVQRSLRRVQRVGRLVLRLAHPLQIGLDRAQLRGLRLQRELRGARLVGNARLPLLRLAQPQQPQTVLAGGQRVLQRAVLARDRGLLLEALELGVELAHDVADAQQVLARVVQPVLGFAPALLVLGHAGGFLEHHAQLLGARFDDATDRSLTDDRVRARAQPGAEEDVLHVAPAHVLVVDVVARRAVARQHALDRDLGVLAEAAADAVVGVVEHQLDAAAPGRLARRRAIEDDVEHGLAAQLGSLGLAEHPAHRVDDVGFAAAVGADHADAAAWKLHRHRVGE
ncbi:hypothetical protein GALL_347350 [mine drainage metagenome]|uniref:Uncharacterized protein n=1 Tax=mine drainage metagenome TaxID=410659 RepID=A0A1J5QJL3_9ZZZZ